MGALRSRGLSRRGIRGIGFRIGLLVLEVGLYVFVTGVFGTLSLPVVKPGTYKKLLAACRNY